MPAIVRPRTNGTDVGAAPSPSFSNSSSASLPTSRYALRTATIARTRAAISVALLSSANSWWPAPPVEDVAAETSRINATEAARK